MFSNSSILIGSIDKYACAKLVCFDIFPSVSVPCTLLFEIVDFAIQNGKISASLVQRKFRLGYNRAARVIDLLEERGIIGPQNGSKPREVLVKMEDAGGDINE